MLRTSTSTANRWPLWRPSTWSLPVRSLSGPWSGTLNIPIDHCTRQPMSTSLKVWPTYPKPLLLSYTVSTCHYRGLFQEDRRFIVKVFQASFCFKWRLTIRLLDQFTFSFPILLISKLRLVMFSDSRRYIRYDQKSQHHKVPESVQGDQYCIHSIRRTGEEMPKVDLFMAY